MRLGARRWTGRIIPARAGFTTPLPLRSLLTWDHPRSRGVYDTNSAQRLIKCGSSPLARGLPAGRCPSSTRRRIIPARAGFTSTPSPSSSTARDHPRSRGVYVGRRRMGAHHRGSSPLARGLRADGSKANGRWRIIPARAGFTATFPAATGEPRDHPRSRGVYRFSRLNIGDGSGSSPLARGLLRIHRMALSGIRIIPARAGFTRVPPPRRGPP